MLVQCEFYEVDGKLRCDVICERCGEVAHENTDYVKVVLDHVLAEKPVVCDECKASACRKCGKMPTPSPYGQWVNGVCWECRDAYYEKLSLQVKALLVRAE